MHVTVVPLSPERRADYLAFFDGAAFADNPEWSGCYCNAFAFTGPRAAWGEQTAAQNRASACRRIDDGRAEGLLAYADGKVVGWCQTGRSSSVPGLAAALGLADLVPADARVVTCFIIAPAARRQGVARALLCAVVEQCTADGATAIFGYPHPGPDESDAERFPGPLALYTELGFLPVGQTRHRSIVRKDLSPDRCLR